MDTKDPEDLPVVVPPRSSWWHHIISGPGKEPLSRDTSIGMAIGLAGLAAAMLPLDWMTRVVLTLFVMGLTIYAASKHPAHPIIRIVATLAVIALFVGFGSRPAWEDFHVKHPTVLLPESMNGLFQPYVIPPKAPPPPFSCCA